LNQADKREEGMVMRKAAVLVLVLMLAVSISPALCGCGGEGQSQPGDEQEGQNGQNGQTTLVFSDPELAFQLTRALGATAYGGADIGECLSTAERITEGDVNSWYAGGASQRRAWPEGMRSAPARRTSGLPPITPWPSSTCTVTPPTRA